MRLFLPSDAPIWLKAFASSVDDKFRSIMTAPFRLLGLAGADLPAPADYAQGLIYDLTAARILYSTGADWHRLFGSGEESLEAIAALTPAADSFVYFTGPSSAALGTVTGFGRSLLDDPDSTAGRSTLGAEAAIAAGTAAQYLRGDKSWQALDASAVAFAPAGSVSAGNVQAAIAELDSGKQPIDAELGAIAGLVSAADRLPYFTGSGTAALATFTAAGRALVDDSDAAAQRTTLGLAIGTNVAPVASPGFTGSLTATQSATGGHAFNSQGVALYANSSNSNSNIVGLRQAGANVVHLGHDSTEGFRISDSAGNLRHGMTLGATPAYRLNGLQVLTTRRTGWSIASGTATRSTFATSTVTTAQLAERVKALIDDLTAHGLIG
ncbi:MAG TPA: hypothetical protein VIT45_12615 [Allosphingosinicella sp.]